MKPFFLLLAASITTPAFAQTDSAGTTVHPATYTSVASLQRADIERLPAINFMELVQGAFPFVGNVPVVEEDYSYVVNGFVTINPNAINLSQIQSIRFYPAGTALTRGSLGKKGTFVINTEPQKSGFYFSTKTGLLLAKDQEWPTQRLQYGTGFTSFNESGYQYKGQRSQFSSAVSYLRTDHPGVVSETSGAKSAGTADFNRLRLSNSGSFRLSNYLNAEGGLFLTTQPRNSSLAADFIPADSEEQTSKQQTLYAGAHAGLRFTLPDKITNHLVAELTYAGQEEDQAVYGLGRSNYSRSLHASQMFRYYSFTNRFSWTPVSSSVINLQANLLIRYRFTNGSEESLTESRSPSGITSRSGFQTRMKSKSFLASPGIFLQIKNLLSAEIGLAYDDYGHSDKGGNTYKKLLPNGGLKLELASLMKGSGISSLELSSTYQKYLTSFDRIDLLGTGYRSSLPLLNPSGTIIFPNPAAAIYTPSENWVSSLAIGWWKNRFILKGSYRVYDQMIRTYYGSPGGGGSYVFFYEPLRSRNWSAEVSATLLEKTSRRWTVYATAFQDKYERTTYGNGLPTTNTAELLYLDAGKAPWRCGLRTNLAINGFYGQAAVLVALNEAGTKKDGSFAEDITTCSSNFLLAGYQWATGARVVKGLDINVQSRNFLNRGDYAIARYIGLGLHLRF